MEGMHTPPLSHLPFKGGNRCGGGFKGGGVEDKEDFTYIFQPSPLLPLSIPHLPHNTTPPHISSTHIHTSSTPLSSTPIPLRPHLPL